MKGNGSARVLLARNMKRIGEDSPAVDRAVSESEVRDRPGKGMAKAIIDRAPD